MILREWKTLLALVVIGSAIGYAAYSVIPRLACPNYSSCLSRR
jgi:hypothetical protein